MLTAKKRNKHSHTHRKRNHSQHHPIAHEVDIDVRDRFISPRIVSITSSSGLSTAKPMSLSAKDTTIDVSTLIESSNPITRQTDWITVKEQEKLEGDNISTKPNLLETRA
jgi:hypothetical protein